MEKEVLCKTLANIGEQVDRAGPGRVLEYVIEWNEDDIDAKAQKDAIEYLNKQGVIRIEGGAVLKDRDLTFRLYPKKKFEHYTKLNCPVAQKQNRKTTVSQTKLPIVVHAIKGIYRGDNPELRYPISGNRFDYICNLYRGRPMEYGLDSSVKDNLPRDRKQINEIFMKNLEVESDLISYSRTYGYHLNDDDFEFQFIGFPQH